MNNFSNYTEFFNKATGFEPYPYQIEISKNFNNIKTIDIPTGLGKTAAVVLSWIWNRVIKEDQELSRRLVYCFPMRVLVSQSFENIKQWLDNLGLTKDINLFQLMGGQVDNNFDQEIDQFSIIVGTQDMLLSRALNRGYAMSKFRWPLHFAFLNNDAQWIFDEIQLMGNGLATSAQLQGFRKEYGTFGKVNSIWMSATLQTNWLNTVDHKFNKTNPDISLSNSDKNNKQIKKLIKANKQLKVSSVKGGGKKGLKKKTEYILNNCSDGNLNIAVFNTVERAVDTYDLIKKLWKDYDFSNLKPVLLHSRYRQPDKQKIIQKILNRKSDEGILLVSTQVIEAGVDISAKVMFTELAPYSSLIQRFGRCNRKGKYQNAFIHWFDLNEKDSLPYKWEELKEAKKILEFLLAGEAEIEKLPHVMMTPDYTFLPRKKDILDLFDTTPDLGGANLDVSRYIRDIEDRNVSVFWEDITKNEKPKNDIFPEKDELCQIPIGKALNFIDRESIRSKNLCFTKDFLSGEWIKAKSNNIYPGSIILISTSAGGYNSEKGWTGNQKDKPGNFISSTNMDESHDGDPYISSSTWQTIKGHSKQVVDELDKIIKNLISIQTSNYKSKPVKGYLKEAAIYHDLGKAHPVFQNAISQKPSQKLYAKIDSNQGNFKRYERKGFRHELASALAILELNKDDLCAYLAAAHHGKVRTSIRSMPHEIDEFQSEQLIARGIKNGDELPACQLPCGISTQKIPLDLSVMELGLGIKGQSWNKRILQLIRSNDLGIFRLAFLEALLRVADWRASKNSKNNKKNKTTK
ncbi:MAG: CRISPR-associated helicase Cas3' [Deltaproteobacteria bacterium]|jgi:CRISPR-associated endonuclease/helicase Cas3|nr:CRISPR-associated helicase Cas3' [Deltaproteobacteria bacterium]